MINFVIYSILCLLIPFLLDKYKTSKYVSPVVLCYAAGIIMSFIPYFELNQDFKQTFMGIAVLLAIPMVLLSTNMSEWLKLTKEVSKAFAITVLSMTVSVFVCSMFYIHKEEIYYLSGMITGGFIGSASNMNAVGLALNTPIEIFLLSNIADIVSSGLFLMIITTVLYPFMNIFLKKYSFKSEEEISITIPQPKAKDYLKTLIWAVGINALVIGFSFLFFKKMEQLFIIIIISILSILLSKLSSKPSTKSSFELGYYLLLIFCIVLGSMVDISMVSMENLWIIGYAGLVLIVAVTLNMVLAYIFKIHSELVIISLAASIYSVPFIGQIALSINKKEIITPGIICSLIGYALGNFLGVGVAYLVKWVSLF